MQSYFHQDIKYQHTITQQLIRIELIFKGWVVKKWINVNQEQKFVMKKINRLTIPHSA